MKFILNIISASNKINGEPYTSRGVRTVREGERRYTPLNLPHQDTIFGGFAPNSETAQVISKSLGSRTVMSGSISRGKNDPSQSLQMMERPLLTPDELKSMPKGRFVVMKTGTHPMRTALRLFLDWGITFGEPYIIEEKANRRVSYADKQELEENIIRRHHSVVAEDDIEPVNDWAKGGMTHSPFVERGMDHRRSPLRT